MNILVVKKILLLRKNYKNSFLSNMSRPSNTDFFQFKNTFHNWIIAYNVISILEKKYLNVISPHNSFIMSCKLHVTAMCCKSLIISQQQS